MPFTVTLIGNKAARNFTMAIASTLVMGLSSCDSNLATSNLPMASTKKLQVVTTFVPITEFTQAVAGDRAQVTQLLPSSVSPHDYQAKPEDIQKLAKAQVLVENGLGMEGFLEDVVKNAENPGLKVIDSSQGIPTIATQSLAPEHGHEAEVEHEHEHGEVNPHIYLDPKRAIQQVKNIRDGLIAADPLGEKIYSANAAAYTQKLKQLDAEIAQKLKPFAGKTFVTYHDFAPYFAQSYQLKADFLVGIPEENAAPEDVKRVMNAAKKSNLKTLLTEPQAAGSPFTALAKDLNVQIGTFDSLEIGGSDSLQSDYYLKTLRQNVKNLETAFSGKKSVQIFPIIPGGKRVLGALSMSRLSG